MTVPREEFRDYMVLLNDSVVVLKIPILSHWEILFGRKAGCTFLKKIKLLWFIELSEIYISMACGATLLSKFFQLL